MASPRDPNTGDLMPLTYFAPPADYSFKELKNFNELEGEQPRASDVFGTDGKFAEDNKKEEGKKYLILVRKAIAIKLNNNLFETLGPDIVGVLNSIPHTPVPRPELNLQWLDLSFNRLVKVESSLLSLKNLKSLYLHANNILTLVQFEKLDGLEHLKVLTCNGNPCEAKTNYRMILVGALGGKLHALDHTSVTIDERKRAVAFFANYVKSRTMAREAAKEAAALKELQDM